MFDAWVQPGSCVGHVEVRAATSTVAILLHGHRVTKEWEFLGGCTYAADGFSRGLAKDCCLQEDRLWGVDVPYKHQTRTISRMISV